MTRKVCIAVIPARGGSKRIPNKNIRSFMGRPIIAYTIDAAKASNIFSSIIVSTDNKEIAELAHNYGAEPFMRKAVLADDHTPVSLVTLDVLENIDPDKDSYQYVAQMMPNCPLRNEVDVVDSHQNFIKTKSYSQISVTRFGWLNPWWAMFKDKENRLSPLFPDQITKRSQDLPEIFCPTGAIWWINAETLRNEKTFYCNERTGWEIPWDHGVDIDTEDDWKMAECLMKHKLGLH